MQHLPEIILFHIISFISIRDLTALQSTSKRYHTSLAECWQLVHPSQDFQYWIRIDHLFNIPKITHSMLINQWKYIEHYLSACQKDEEIFLPATIHIGLYDKLVALPTMLWTYGGSHKLWNKEVEFNLTSRPFMTNGNTKSERFWLGQAGFIIVIPCSKEFRDKDHLEMVKVLYKEIHENAAENRPILVVNWTTSPSTLNHITHENELLTLCVELQLPYVEIYKDVMQDCTPVFQLLILMIVGRYEWFSNLRTPVNGFPLSSVGKPKRKCIIL